MEASSITLNGNNISINKEKEDSISSNAAFESIENAFQTILNAVHPNPSHPELLKTPSRAAKGFLFLVEGYKIDPYAIAKDALFESYSSNMIVIKNITVNSVCEHHLLPFVGRCDIGYIPTQKILGLSKFSRIVDCYSRRLQVQERLTIEIASFLDEILRPEGVIVKIDSKHLCSQIRGVEEKDSMMESISTLGKFKSDSTLITQFLSLIEKDQQPKKIDNFSQDDKIPSYRQKNRYQKREQLKNKHATLKERLKSKKMLIEPGKKFNASEKQIINIEQKLSLLKIAPQEKLVYQMLSLLKEQNKGLIQNIVDNYSKDKIVQFLEETLESFKNKNGEKNRTLGGVFIKLIKEDVKENDAMNYKNIFKPPIEKIRKRNQMKSRRRKDRKNQSKKIGADTFADKAKKTNIFEIFNQ